MINPRIYSIKGQESSFNKTPKNQPKKLSKLTETNFKGFLARTVDLADNSNCSWMSSREMDLLSLL